MLPDALCVVRTFAHSLLIVALSAMIGGHWIFLQSVAWTSMLSQNLRTASLSEAIGKTFDGRHPCRLCKAIQAGKQSENKSEAPAPLKKVEFVSIRPVFRFHAPQSFTVLPVGVELLSSTAHRPPVPPPRPFAA